MVLRIQCILLDHVPHDENSKPAFGDETTYHRAALTLYIPDVKCERCHLQFLTVMSDEFHGVPEGTTCALASAQRAGKADVSLPSCSAVYHSCAPVSINGTMPGAEHTCSLSHHEEQLRWPFSAGKPPASTYFYKGDPGLYDTKTKQLLSEGSPIEGCSAASYCNPDGRSTNKIPGMSGFAHCTGACLSTCLSMPA